MAHDHEMYMVLADTAAQSHDKPALQKYAPLLEQVAERDDHKFYLAIAHRAWGVAHRLEGDYSKSKARLKAALELFESFGARWQIGRTLAEMGQLELSKSKGKPAREHFLKALTAFEDIRAMPDVTAMKSLLT